MAKEKKTYRYSVLLGQRIEEVIKENYDGTVYDFVIDCGIPKTSFYRIINGETYDPSIRLISRMAAYLKVSMDVFFDTPELRTFDYDLEDPNRPNRSKNF